MQEITAIELNNWLNDKANKPILLDVREPWEHIIANIKAAQLIPMNEIPSEIKFLDDNLPYVCICHHGIRSARVAVFLEGKGFKQVYNLTGGIESWSNLVDKS